MANSENPRQNLEKRVAIGGAGLGLLGIALGFSSLAGLGLLAGVGAGGVYLADRAITSKRS